MKKTEGPTTILEYLGLTIDTQNIVVKIPADKVKELLNQIKTVASAKKVTLKQLQSLCGLLAFCTKALPAGRSFSRQLYMATSKANKTISFHQSNKRTCLKTL